MCISNAHAYQFVIWLKHVYHKYNFGHFILLLSYATFILISATAFFLIESFNAHSFRTKWQRRLSEERKAFVDNDLLPEIFNNTRLLLYIHGSKSNHLKTIVNDKLQEYENQLKLKPPMPTLPCTFTNSLMFVFSTITTIGYGYIYPVTDEGRILSIIVSLFGIPFTIIVVKDIAYLLAILLNYPCRVLEKLWAMFRFCTLRPVDEHELERKLHGDKGPRKDYRLENTERLLAVPVTIAVMAVAGWTSLGCLIVHLYMPTTDTSVAFYFIFNSLATIGVGDIEPGDHSFILVLLFVYLLIGLSIISLFINLLHTKFSQAYWLPGTMYMPLKSHIHPCEQHRSIAQFDSIDDMTMSECPINHFTTLGILQTDDKCPLIGITKRESSYTDAVTQTDMRHSSQLKGEKSLDGIQLGHGVDGLSQDDLHSLIVETYGSRPARLITSQNIQGTRHML